MSPATAVKPQIDDKKKQTPVSLPKEVEPKADGRAQESAAIAEIKEVSASADREVLELLEKDLTEITAREPKPDIPPDVADAGVSSPEADGEAVIANGPTINIDLSEKEYEEGLKASVNGKTDSEKTVFGTSSLVAMALWITRMMKLAHKHTMRIVFRKEVKNAG